MFVKNSKEINNLENFHLSGSCVTKYGTLRKNATMQITSCLHFSKSWIIISEIRHVVNDEYCKKIVVNEIICDSRFTVVFSGYVCEVDGCFLKFENWISLRKHKAADHRKG